MLAANPYWENTRIYLAKIMSPFGMEGVNIFLDNKTCL